MAKQNGRRQNLTVGSMLVSFRVQHGLGIGEGIDIVGEYLLI